MVETLGVSLFDNTAQTNFQIDNLGSIQTRSGSTWSQKRGAFKTWFAKEEHNKMRFISTSYLACELLNGK